MQITTKNDESLRKMWVGFILKHLQQDSIAFIMLAKYILCGKNTTRVKDATDSSGKLRNV